MKIDMSPEAVTLRLQQVEQLRRVCLALAAGGTGREIRAAHPNNETVRRTSGALPSSR